MTNLPLRLTLPQALRRQAQERPGVLAIRQKAHGIWKPVSWADYLHRAGHVGLGLRALGLSDGAHVAVLSENRVEWVLTQLGAGLVGATATTIVDGWLQTGDVVRQEGKPAMHRRPAEGPGRSPSRISARWWSALRCGP